VQPGGDDVRRRARRTATPASRRTATVRAA
jgi:hypothetical protein